LSLRHFRITIVKPGTYNKIQDGVSKEFKPFVVLRYFRMFINVRAVG
jgi:hypothetical protein